MICVYGGPKAWESIMLAKPLMVCIPCALNSPLNRYEEQVFCSTAVKAIVSKQCKRRVKAIICTKMRRDKTYVFVRMTFYATLISENTVFFQALSYFCAFYCKNRFLHYFVCQLPFYMN